MTDAEFLDDLEKRVFALGEDDMYLTREEQVRLKQFVPTFDPIFDDDIIYCWREVMHITINQARSNLTAAVKRRLLS